MTLRYLPEYIEVTTLALALAEKEAEHLSYTCKTLFSQPIDLQWVENLVKREDLAEKIDAFVARFGRLQDHLGEKLIPHFAHLLGEQPKSLLDVLSYAERMEWIESADMFIDIRKLRNLLVHEYMHNAKLFFEALLSANPAAQSLIKIVAQLRQQLQGLLNNK